MQEDRLSRHAYVLSLIILCVAVFYNTSHITQRAPPSRYRDGISKALPGPNP